VCFVAERKSVGIRVVVVEAGEAETSRRRTRRERERAFPEPTRERRETFFFCVFF
jgi:hypothetical protein